MCGRYASPGEDAEIAGELGISDVAGSGAPSWNVAPTQQARIVVAGPDGALRLRTARWGLIPWWAADDRGAARTINARIETVESKPAYRDAVLRRRALVPASGYYEWERGPLGTVPHFLSEPGRTLTFAGLWEQWRAPDAQLVCSFTILTRAAPDTLRHIHDRAPVVVPAGTRRAWLNPATTGPEEVRALLGALHQPVLTATVVGKAVGSVANDGPYLAAPVLPAQPTLFG